MFRQGALVLSLKVINVSFGCGREYFRISRFLPALIPASMYPNSLSIRVGDSFWLCNEAVLKGGDSAISNTRMETFPLSNSPGTSKTL
jgi:hypothetical protein